MMQRVDTIPAPAVVRLTEAADSLISLYTSWGKQSEATKWQEKLAATHIRLGKLLSGLDRRVEAEEHYDKAVSTYEKLADDYEKLAAKFPAKTDHRVELARTCNSLGALFSKLGRWGEGEKQYQKALSINNKLAAEFPDVSAFRSAAAETLYHFGCLYAVRCGKAKYKKQELEDRAMELIKHAVKEGYNDAAHIAKDADLEPLRSRADFRELLHSVLNPKPKE
jgi:tetratricopeptide (TPR) repeat protein